MPLFRYVALNISGKKQRGVLEAAHLQEAKERLRQQGTILLKIHPFQSTFLSSFKKKSFNGTVLATFTSQFSELMKAKVPLYESLLSLEEMYRGESFHHVVQSLVDHIKKGETLSSALSKFPDSFSTLYVSMIKAGEAIGALDTTLVKLADLIQKQNQLKKKLVTSLIYPGLLLSFSFLVIMTMLVFVIPSIQALFTDRTVNGLTKIVFNLSHFVTSMWPFYCPFLALTTGFGILFFQKKKKLLRGKFLSLPMIKKVMIESSMARFCRTLSTLLEGGVNMKDALTMSRGVIGFPLIEAVIASAENKIYDGSLLSIELKKSPLIPSLVSRMVSIGEEGGNMASMLEKSAAFFEEEVDKKLSRLMALSGPMILLIMGFFVGIIMMAVLLPLTDASSFIT